MRKLVALAAIFISSCSTQNSPEETKIVSDTPLKNAIAAFVIPRNGPTIIISNLKGKGGVLLSNKSIKPLTSEANGKLIKDHKCQFAAFIVKFDGNLTKSHPYNKIVVDTIIDYKYASGSDVEEMTKYSFDRRAKPGDLCN